MLSLINTYITAQDHCCFLVHLQYASYSVLCLPVWGFPAQGKLLVPSINHQLLFTKQHNVTTGLARKGAALFSMGWTVGRTLQQTKDEGCSFLSCKLSSYFRPCWAENYWVTLGSRTDIARWFLQELTSFSLKRTSLQMLIQDGWEGNSTDVFWNNPQSRQCGLSFVSSFFLCLQSLSLPVYRHRLAAPVSPRHFYQ